MSQPATRIERDLLGDKAVRATELAAEAMRTGRGIRELVREQNVLTEQQVAEVLDPITMTGGFPTGWSGGGRSLRTRCS